MLFLLLSNYLINPLASCSLRNFDFLLWHTVHFGKSMIVQLLVLITFGFLISVFYTSTLHYLQYFYIFYFYTIYTLSTLFYLTIKCYFIYSLNFLFYIGFFLFLHSYHKIIQLILLSRLFYHASFSFSLLTYTF